MGDHKFSDSDLENSSESEDDFVKKEFCKDYDNQKPIRQKLSKTKLIEEFMMMERDVKMLEKKYAEMKAEEELKVRLGRVEWKGGEATAQVAEKIRIFQEEILKIAQENRVLRMENNRLLTENRALDSTSSSESDDSSDSSSDSDDSSTDDDDTGDEEDEEKKRRRLVQEDLQTEYKDSDSESKRNDTGYESDPSGLETDLVSSSIQCTGRS